MKKDQEELANGIRGPDFFSNAGSSYVHGYRMILNSSCSGPNLRRRAEKLGISNAEVARRTDLSDRRYGNYVSGRREPDLATLIRIARVLVVSVDELVASSLDERKGTAEELFQERINVALRALGYDDLQRLTVMVEALAMTRRDT